MNRFHVHLNVARLEPSIEFYSALFARGPDVLKPDYAKWMLDDPRVNFAVSSTGRTAGIDHLGIQVENGDDLDAIGARLRAAAAPSQPESAAACCYALSDKVWSEDPQGLRWETFLTHGESTTYYGGEAPCATDGTRCSTDVARVSPPAGPVTSCCPPASACC